MKNYKKLLSISLSLLLLTTQGMAESTNTFTANSYDSGKEKIIQIMSDPKTGIPAYTQKIRYAETENLSKDLNIAQIAACFECKTAMGQHYLETTLEKPISTFDTSHTLLRRQQAVKALVENPQLKKEVERLLCVAQQEEHVATMLLSDFFKGKTCPELLENNGLKNNIANFTTTNPVGKIAWVTVKAGILAKLLSYAHPTGQFTYDILAKKTTEIDKDLEHTQKLLQIIELKNYSYNTLASQYDDYESLLQEIDDRQLTFYDALADCMRLSFVQAAQKYRPLKVFGLSGVSVYGAFSAYMTYNLCKGYSQAAEKRLAINSLNRLIAISKRFDALYKENDIKNQFTVHTNRNSKPSKLFKKLSSSRYTYKQSVGFMAPLVHTFLYELYQKEQHLTKLFACIAEMDAYNAIATKIIESQNSKNKFCFATFIENDKPAINTQGFWNVLVGNKAVSNNLIEDRDVILTGPNAGGKTTSIRAILQNIVLGQTFGVAAAESFEFTQFDIIHSYLNVSDDLINGLSLFASEIKRAQDILKKTNSLTTSQKFFLALDELFTGTVAEDGEKCAYEFVNKLATFENLQFIYATHFHKLKQLGHVNERCINYKVDAPTKVNGKLVYPFTLSQGANESNIGLEIATQAGLFA